MRISRPVLRYLLVVIALLTGASKAIAQDWTKLGTLPANVHCGYFWDFNHGVVGIYDSYFGKILNAGIYTYDNGIWTKSKYPEAPSAISSIRMLSPGHLYATQGVTQAWVSTDSGKTWDTSGVHCGVQWPPTQFGVSFVPAQDIYLAADGTIHVVPGRYVQNSSGLFLAGGTFARIDDQHCVISYTDTGMKVTDMGVPYYSRDGGTTWNRSTGMNEMGGFGCFADTCQHVFFTAAEWGSVYFSIDSGVTWQRCTGQLDAGAGDMDVLNGANGTMYKQTVSSGIFQSVDGGTSWQWIRLSPKSSVEDTRIFPVGSYGSEFVCFSAHDVWYVTGANFNSRPASPISVADSTLHECYPTDVVPVLIRPTGIRHKLHFLTEGDSTHLLLPNDTTILTPGHDGVVFRFHITPPDIHGATSLRIHSHIGDNCFPLDWDTTFVDTISSSAFGIIGASTTSILACDSTILPIAIQSMLCDSFALTSTQMLNDSQHRLSILPMSRHRFSPGELDTIWFKYKPHGIPEDRSYNIHMTGVLAPSNIPIDTLLKLHLVALPDKRCNQDTTTATVEQEQPALTLFRLDHKLLSFTHEGSGNAFAEIINVLGQTVGRRTISDDRNNDRSPLSWDLTHLPAGAYVFQISFGDRSLSRRFVLQ